MKATFLKGVLLGSVVSLATLTGTAAFAGTGVGGVLNLGRFNGVNAQTTIGGSTAGKQLNVVNTKNAAGSTGIGITVHAGKPPLVVNSSTKVTHLNADQLDGLHSSAFQLRAVYPIYHSLGISPAYTVETFGRSKLKLFLSCQNGSTVGLVYQNTGTNTGTVYESFSTGGVAPTVGEATVGAGGSSGFSATKPRLAGQFIWTTTTGHTPSVKRYIVTINIHEVNTGTGCVFTGTAELATKLSKF